MKLAQAGMIAISVAMLLSALGCAQKEKQEIQALTAEKQDLMNQNRDLQAQLAAAKARETELLAQRDSKQVELDAALARLRETEAKPASAGPPPAPGWERGPLGDMVTVGSDILFESGKAALTASGRSALDKIVADIKKSYAGLPIRIYGHTDNEPIQKSRKLWQDNLDLSANRAMSVTRYLISRGVSTKVIETVAMGEHHPLASNTSKAQRAKNRRVEIIVVRKGG
jgi:chemotaxis protein MotB